MISPVKRDALIFTILIVLTITLTITTTTIIIIIIIIIKKQIITIIIRPTFLRVFSAQEQNRRSCPYTENTGDGKFQFLNYYGYY